MKPHHFAIGVVVAVMLIAITVLMESGASSLQEVKNTPQHQVTAQEPPPFVPIPQEPINHDYVESDNACDSDFIIEYLKRALKKNTYAQVPWKYAFANLDLPVNNIVTLGKTFRGYVCDADVNSYNEKNEKLEGYEVFYRIDLSSNGKRLWIEILDRNTAMLAK